LSRFPLPCPTLRPVSACNGLIPECCTLRLAAYPSACSNGVSTPPLPPPPPLPRIPQAMFMISYSPRYDHGGSDPTLLSSFPPPKLLRSTGEPGCAPPPYHFTCHDDASAWFCLYPVSVRIHEPLERHTEKSRRDKYVIRCHGSRRVLLIVRGVLFRVGPNSVSCRRVLCFYSIHSAPPHFVSVNPASSGGSSTFPSPLYAQVRLPVCSHRT